MRDFVRMKILVLLLVLALPWGRVSAAEEADTGGEGTEKAAGTGGTLPETGAAAGIDTVEMGVCLSLEDCIAYINDDELVEITPASIRLRKKKGARIRG